MLVHSTVTMACAGSQVLKGSRTSGDRHRLGRHISVAHQTCSSGECKAVHNSEAGDMDHSAGRDLRCAATPLPTVLLLYHRMPQWLCDHFSTHRYVTWKNNSVSGTLLFLLGFCSLSHNQWQPKPVSKEFLICHRDSYNTQTA